MNTRNQYTAAQLLGRRVRLMDIEFSSCIGAEGVVVRPAVMEGAVNVVWDKPSYTGIMPANGDWMAYRFDLVDEADWEIVE